MGLFIADDYGSSWDELYDIDYGRESLKAYGGSAAFDWLEPVGYYGPAFVMFSELSSRVFVKFISALQMNETYHFTYFLSFLRATFSLYNISLRFADNVASISTAMLFMTQLLLLRHAVINANAYSDACWTPIPTDAGH